MTLSVFSIVYCHTHEQCCSTTSCAYGAVCLSDGRLVLDCLSSQLSARTTVCIGVRQQCAMLHVACGHEYKECMLVCPNLQALECVYYQTKPWAYVVGVVVLVAHSKRHGRPHSCMPAAPFSLSCLAKQTICLLTRASHALLL